MLKLFQVVVPTMLIGTLVVQAGEMLPNLYGPNSGRITYKTQSKGSILGNVIEGTGKARLIFDDHGKRTLTETVEVRHQTILGRAKTTRTHRMTLMDKDTLYQVDFKHKKITKMPNPSSAIMAQFSKVDPIVAGRKLMEQMGGKQIGEDVILGYRCEMWQLMGTTQCVYRGIPLQVKSNIMGIQIVKIATEAAFDIALKSKAFLLPDFPTVEAGGGLGIDPGMDASRSDPSVDVAALGQMIRAGAQAQNPSSPQASQAMANAMLPMMKQQFLKQATPMRHMRDCLGHANTRKQAIVCGRKYDPKFDPTNVPPRWDAATKRQTLQEMDQYLDQAVPCIRNAKTMQQVQACMPR